MMNHCWYHTQYQVLQLPVNGPSASPHLLAARAIARPTQHVLLQPVDDPTVQQLLQLPIIVAAIVDCAQHTERVLDGFEGVLIHQDLTTVGDVRHIGCNTGRYTQLSAQR